MYESSKSAFFGKLASCMETLWAFLDYINTWLLYVHHSAKYRRWAFFLYLHTTVFVSSRHFPSIFIPALATPLRTIYKNSGTHTLVSMLIDLYFRFCGSLLRAPNLLSACFSKHTPTLMLLSRVDLCDSLASYKTHYYWWKRNWSNSPKTYYDIYYRREEIKLWN